jgi:hypothetical protein
LGHVQFLEKKDSMLIPIVKDVTYLVVRTITPHTNGGKQQRMRSAVHKHDI